MLGAAAADKAELLEALGVERADRVAGDETTKQVCAGATFKKWKGAYMPELVLGKSN